MRAVFRSLAEGAASPATKRDPDGAGDDELREALAELLADMARAMRDFATLVRAEGDESGEPHVAELEDALDAAREARVRLTELLLVDPREALGLWQRRGSLLAGVERVLAELDAEERRRRTTLRREEAAAARRPAAQAAERLRSTTRRRRHRQPGAQAVRAGNATGDGLEPARIDHGLDRAPVRRRARRSTRPCRRAR